MIIAISMSTSMGITMATLWLWVAYASSEQWPDIFNGKY